MYGSGGERPPNRAGRTAEVSPRGREWSSRCRRLPSGAESGMESVLGCVVSREDYRDGDRAVSR